MTSRAQEYYTQAVLIIGTAFLLRSAYTLLTLSSNASSSSSRSSRGKRASSSTSRPPARLVSESAVYNITYTATIQDCQSTSQGLGAKPKIRAGSLLKLIDVAAGVAARRHAKTTCVTISVDSVLFLNPVRLGELIHISASVNRAWGTSMEIGVVVFKSDDQTNSREYVSHSYLTFVAINRQDTLSSQTIKPVLATIKPSSQLEARRHLLAGRRRKKRIEDAQKGEARDGVSIQVKRQVREQVLSLLKQQDSSSQEELLYSEEQRERLQRRLKAVEIEYLIRSWAMEEDGIVLKDGRVHVIVPDDEPFSHPEDEIRSTARSLGVSLPGDKDYQSGKQLSSDFFNPSWLRHRSSSITSIKGVASSSVTSNVLPCRATLTTSMHLVFSRHTNSNSVIFGGNTMSWSEDVALMACRNLSISCRGSVQKGTWKTVAMDGLEFNVKVVVGELMILTALVIKTHQRSCEVYVMAQAEDRDGKRRFTNDVLFTLALDNSEKDESHIVSTIEMPAGSALQVFASASDLRRQQRLELKRVLTRLYS